jgi:hypothetical protein
MPGGNGSLAVERVFEPLGNVPRQFRVAHDPVAVLIGCRLLKALEEETAELPGSPGPLLVQESPLVSFLFGLAGKEAGQLTEPVRIFL